MQYNYVISLVEVGEFDPHIQQEEKKKEGHLHKQP